MRFLNPIKKKVPGTDVDAINNAPNKFISKYRMLTTIEEKEKAPRRQFSNLAGYGAGARRAEAEKPAKFGRRSATPPAFSPAVEAD